MKIVKVLYAEDDPLTVMEVTDKLEEKGFEVIVAVDGNEAWKKFKECRPDIVVLDIDMPGKNGFEVLELIRLKDRRTPIVIYSSLGDESYQLRGLESGAYNYLLKNSSPAVVAAQVQRCLAKDDDYIVELEKHIVYDLSTGWLKMQGHTERLKGIEYKIFNLLCKGRNTVVSRDVLIEAGWRDNEYRYSLQLNKVISALRKRFADFPSIEIMTDQGNGYMLKV